MVAATKVSDGGLTSPASAIGSELARFRAHTVQRDYTFLASFLDSDLADLVDPQQILAIVLPQVQFTKEAVFKSIYPVAYAKYDSDGWEVHVVIREDARGGVRTLIDRLIGKIRRPNGIYNAPNKAKFLGMQVKILDYSGHVTDVYQLRNMMYLQAEDIAFKHDGGEVMAIDITFHLEDVLRVGNV